MRAEMNSGGRSSGAFHAQGTVTSLPSTGVRAACSERAASDTPSGPLRALSGRPHEPTTVPMAEQRQVGTEGHQSHKRT